MPRRWRHPLLTLPIAAAHHARSSRPRPYIGVLAVLLGSIISTLDSRITTFGLADRPRRRSCRIRRGRLDHHRLYGRPNADRAGIGLARRGVRRAPRADDLGCRLRDLQFPAAILARSRLRSWRSRLISGLASGTFIPLTIGFVVQNLPPRMVIYGVAAYAMNLELSLNIAASIEGWFCDNWSWHWIFWDTALLAPLMLVCIHFGMPRQPINRALLKNADWAGILYARARLQSALRRARPGQPARLAEFRTDQRTAARAAACCSSPLSCRS